MTPQQIIFLSIIGIALVALIFLSESQKHYNLDSIKRKTVGDGQYGTAKWATRDEISKCTVQIPFDPEAWRRGENLPDTAGIIINLTHSRHQLLATIDPSDNHTLMVAGTGGGKTTTFMIPNIEYALACGISFICTDSKGDLLRLYGKLCEQYGYKCLNINFRSPIKSDSYNYMQLINLYIDIWRNDPKRIDCHSRAERYAKTLANSIIHTKGFDGGGQNAYFYDASEGLITSIILLVAQYCKPEERHIVSVFKLLLEFIQTVKSANEDMNISQKQIKRTKLNEILNLLPEDDKIRWFAGSVPDSEGAQYMSVLTTSMSRLLAFIDSETESILCHDSKVTITDMCEHKVAVFVTFPEEDATKHVLVSLLLNQIINEAIAYADEHTVSNKLSRRLYIFADEFGIFPHMSNIVGMFGSARSRNIIIVPCIQSPAQLKQTYGAEGETIIRDCCQTVIFGGFSPMSDTAVTFSKLLGNQTVAAGSVSTNNRENRSLFDSGSNSSRSVNMIARPLMTPDELQLLPFGKWIVNRRGSHPFIANMPRYDKWGIRLEAPYISETREYVPTAYAKLDDVIQAIKEEKWRQTVRQKRESHNSSEPKHSGADY